MAKVSVIVPIYNVERYVERCVVSLMEQTLDDIEYVFVNDCTPDKSIDILQDVIELYPDRKKNVKIHKMSTNSGLAAVRGQGLDLATGEYVIYCDADDWVDLDLYELMYDAAKRKNADIVCCPVKDEYVDKSIKREYRQLPPSSSLVVENWYRNSIGMFTWNKLVKRSVFIDNNVRPIKGINMWEDNCLMLRVMYYAQCLVQIYNSYYHYNRANTNSLTKGYGREAINQMIKCAEILTDFFESKPDYLKYKKTVYAVQFLAKLNLIVDRFDWLREYRHIFPESKKVMKFIKLNAFSTKGKIRFIFVRFHLAPLFVALFKLRNFLCSI